ncbi:MAG: tryptophan--tRNA ligase [Planctomycetes bacterium]|nr:tryptophan--tRNA ligase [Planctomycetota bacterium]MCB9902472.1 tryptophan--tRNA ligase [Planctomycetota bacterium]
MRILSGLKPTGRPHLGNYFGALRQWVELQDKGEPFYFLADLHALNQVRDAATMREYTLGAALDYFALGLDPERATIFVQSEVPEISELTWILGTVTPMGLLQRAHAYKDALAKGEEVDYGLFAYPVLMAADILAYDSDIVPVGQDQKQHVEITRDIAVKLNQTYCSTFDPQTGEGGALKLPQPMIVPETATVPGTDGRKMSKSYGNTIPLFGTDKETKKAIMGIVTDSASVEAPKDPASCNVFALLKLLAPADELPAIEEQYRAGGTGYGAFKTLLLERFHDRFDAARARRQELAADPGVVRDALTRGAEKARAVAGEVLARVQRAVGIR